AFINAGDDRMLAGGGCEAKAPSPSTPWTCRHAWVRCASDVPASWRDLWTAWPPRPAGAAPNEGERPKCLSSVVSHCAATCAGAAPLPSPHGLPPRPMSVPESAAPLLPLV